MSTSTIPLCIALGIVTVFSSISLNPAQGDDAGGKDLASRARQFIRQAEQQLAPLEVAAEGAWWDASISGKDADYDRAKETKNKINAVLSDRPAFARLKRIHLEIEKSKKFDPLLARQIKLLYLRYLGKQVAPGLLEEVTALQSKIEKAFNVYRAEIAGKKFSDNELQQILKESTDSKKLQQAWEGGKGVGAVIEADLLALVRKRNEIAVRLGFNNFHQMSLVLDEHTTEGLTKLFGELDDLTREAFREAKADIDARLAKRLNLTIADLRPWHYQNPFFQEAPAVYDVDLDSLYKDVDIPKLCGRFFNGIGLPVDGVLKRSSLFPREGKSPHAFCTDIDRKGDVRVLANIAQDERWASTMLHELGHAVYSSVYYPKKLPFFLRAPSHTLTTEGLAMMVERQTKVLAWMKSMDVALGDKKKQRAIDEVARKMLRNKLLIFSRWAQVMFHFEKSMYENPNQDLNKRWWDLVEKYQLLRRPEGRDQPDYASKIHVVVAPVYYHNYALGELFASQVNHAMAKDALGGVSPQGLDYSGDKRVGKFIQAKIIDPGATLDFNALTRHATGETLNPKAFAKDMAAKGR